MDNQESNNSFASIYTPVALVALALSGLFFSQINSFKNLANTMKWQAENMDKQIATYKDNREKLAKGIEERKPSVATSADQQTRFARLLKKVNDLKVDGDEDAKVIINILVNSGITNIPNVPDEPGTEPKKEPEPKKDR